MRYPVKESIKHKKEEIPEKALPATILQGELENNFEPFGLPIKLSSQSLDIAFSKKYFQNKQLEPGDIYQLVADTMKEISDHETLYYIEGVVFSNKENSEFKNSAWIEYSSNLIVDIFREDYEEQMMYIPFLQVPFDVVSLFLEYNEPAFPVHKSEAYNHLYINFSEIVKDYIFPHRAKICDHLVRNGNM